ncbi:unnamed protein product [Meloidogyne enterolobii]|uniref:Uncharacterized protein n=1 Tax=Meloidogyne enterolobii TaxID=390850 RepID=A0ACB0XXS1_MELEN
MPELSGFWILTALLHLPSQLFLGLNPDIWQLPLEKYTILLEIIFSFIELLTSTILLRKLSQLQMERFKRAATLAIQKEEEKQNENKEKY